MKNSNELKRLKYIFIFIGCFLSSFIGNGFLLYTSHVFHEYDRFFELLRFIFYCSLVLLITFIVYVNHLLKRITVKIPKIKLFLITLVSLIVSWYVLGILYEAVGII